MVDKIGKKLKEEHKTNKMMLSYYQKKFNESEELLLTYKQNGRK